jgi:methylated-DNA-[protein]-cysteine S-methyltransferase
MPWTLFDTPLGTCGFAWTDEGLTAVQLPEATLEATERRLRAKAEDAGPRATARSTPAWVKKAIDSARVHFDGQPQDFSTVPLDLRRVTPFEAKVYRALQTVPPGSTITYGELARAVGSAGASRAIGRAMATNPFPIVVPCQRVLASAGKPGGFSAHGGIVTKERMLILEGGQPTAKSTMDSPLFASSDASSLPYDAIEACRHLSSADPVLAVHLERIGEYKLRLEKTEGTFAALAEAIVYQQLNGKAAATIFGRVRSLFRKGRLEPKALLALSDEQLRAAGLSRSKLAALRDLSERAAAGSIPTLAQLGAMDDAAIIERLTEVRGIGPWTVEMLLIFRLGRPDVLPVTDYGIKKGFARLFHRGKRKENELPTAEDMLRRATRWRPFRSVASWYLWRAAEME